MSMIRFVKKVSGKSAERARKSARFQPGMTSLEGRQVLSNIVEFPLPPLSSGGSQGAAAITAGPDGNVWLSDSIAGNVGNIAPNGAVTEFPTPFHDAGPITRGPDGNLWFATGGQFGTGDIARITPAGQVSTFTTPDEFNSITGITAGPDGNVWFAESIYPTGEKVGKITPSGQVTEFTVPVPSGVSGRTGGITTGPDGNLWFTHDGALAMITPTGALHDHVADAVGMAITRGPDGNIWTSGPEFNQQTGAVLDDLIHKITLSGGVTTFSVGTTSATAPSIATGPDGNVYFTEPDANQIGRITPAGAISLFTVPTTGSQPTAIVAGPNGNLWFTEAASRQIGEFILTGTPPPGAAPTTTALAIDLNAPQVGQAVKLAASVSSTSGTPSGSVTFFDGNTVLGTANLSASGQAVLATEFPTAGTQGLTAVFDGTSAFAPSRSSIIKETVQQDVTTTTLTASANPAPVGKKLTLTVKVTPSFAGAGAPRGTVVISDNGVILAFGNLGPTGEAVFTFTPGQTIKTVNGRFTTLPKGTHRLKVTYEGDGNFASSASATLVLTVV
jgi:streptogramin lyase